MLLLNSQSEQAIDPAFITESPIVPIIPWGHVVIHSNIPDTSGLSACRGPPTGP